MKRNGAATEGRELAPFAAVEPAPADAGMWPAHPAAWFEPQLPPELPAVSGLRVERRCTVPAPDFLRFEPSPASLPHTYVEPDFLPPDLPAGLPESDLVPLGWDPRVACRKGNR